ncbi:MAG: hypothetical protein HGA97_06380 [Chlorobiaceae bacterium]|nr:hypothetical protein [Chlorobiaceae bacterium]
MSKSTLTPRDYIFRVAVDTAFRSKYLNKPDALKNDFQISDADFEGIKKIDTAKLGTELEKIKAGGGISAGGLIAGYHQNSSHESHCKGGDPHCKDSHTKGSTVMVPRDFDKVVLPASIASKITGVAGKGKIIR